MPPTDITVVTGAARVNNNDNYLEQPNPGRWNP